MWDAFQAQYESVIAATSSVAAPWYIIPADSKSSRNQLILEILINRLSALGMQYPQVDTRDWPKTVE